MKRRKTRTVRIGDVYIGSDHPVSIQSMTNTVTADIPATVSQIKRLEKAGCEIVRVSVKSPEDAKAVEDIREEIGIPLVADIHFDHRLALEAVKRGADKIRINPGNIRRKDHIDRVISACRERGVPVRIGVNSGSLTESASGKGKPCDVMVSSLLGYMEHFRKAKFDDLVISLKSSDVETTVKAYRLMADECDHPFHLGVTAAGTRDNGIVKASIGIGSLLLDGIGDTVRVSLTAAPEEEVTAAKRILSSVGSRKFGHEIIACPTCGRCQVDLEPIVNEIEKALCGSRFAVRGSKKHLLIAVMGCEVNGPGEAKAADVGIAFGKGKGAIFKEGKIIRTVNADIAVRELMSIIEAEGKE
ncbi:MAG: flavodoxin-dependent (E)-4-hydroxy-3-methylbut-2-enyl-diphosphate synthase [Candidatus Omnitrophica bacterium]|nr:flavodoxin-dependent (E)-4-hydroxy-3-methylbut-2-enyl-diphosphate synthase [Candidatus Omnitrophota bacterium]